MLIYSSTPFAIWAEQWIICQFYVNSSNNDPTNATANEQQYTKWRAPNTKHRTPANTNTLIVSRHNYRRRQTTKFMANLEKFSQCQKAYWCNNNKTKTKYRKNSCELNASGSYNNDKKGTSTQQRMACL